MVFLDTFVQSVKDLSREVAHLNERFRQARDAIEPRSMKKPLKWFRILDDA